MDNFKGFVGHDTVIKNVSGSETSKIYNHCRVSDSELRDLATIGDFSTVRESSIGERSTIQRNCDIWRIKVGKFTCIERICTIQATEIGSFCALSWDLKIGGDDHDYKMASIHPFWHNVAWGLAEDTEYSEWYHEKEYEDPCIIGNDVWMGSGVSVNRNVRIGNGCVIGAGAVITKDIEPYSIVVGVPGRVLKKRFNDKIIERLEKIKWWDWPTPIIKANLRLFRDSHINEEVLEKMEQISYELKNIKNV